MKNKSLKLILLATALLLTGCNKPSSSERPLSSEKPVSSEKVSSDAPSSESASSESESSIPESSEPVSSEPVSSEPTSSEPVSSEPSSSESSKYENEISIAEAIEIAIQAGGTGTSIKYTVIGTVKEIKSYDYGDMTITDGTSELYIYGPRGADGYTYFNKMESTPAVGDKVVLHGVLKDYNGTPEMDHPAIIEFEHIDVPFDDSQYTSKTIAEARSAKKGELIKISGVVAKHTYATGMAKNGVYIVDETGSIYVYGKDLANTVKVGNTVTIAGEKDYYILETESTPAGKWGYTGCNQLSNATVVSNDNLTTGEWDKSWVSEKTVKEIMETPYTQDSTTTIYKTTALVNKVEGTGFTNYYINDLDGYTGTYSYSQASGADYSWLDEYDGKICTVYVALHNAKSENKGCTWRFVPIAAEVSTDYDTSMWLSGKNVYDYYLEDQLDNYYYEDRDVNLELTSVITNDVLGFTANVQYDSTNTDVAFIENVDGKTILHTKDMGKATIRTIVTVENGGTYEKQVEIEVQEIPEFTANTVQYAIESETDTEVTLHGVVLASVVNQSGFYIQDSTGIITVIADEAVVASLSVGDEIVIKGTRGNKIKANTNAPGQICVFATDLLVNFHGNNPYSTDKFITGKTLNDIYVLDGQNALHSTEVYIVTAKVVVIEELYFTKINLEDESGTLELYCASAGQYSFLKPYANKTVTLEINPCNYNKTFYKGCVISVQDSDGVKTVNSLNFSK